MADPRRNPTRQFWWRRHVIYRCYDAGGQLLYIGLSQDIVTRLKQHRSATPWFDRVAKTVVKLAPDRRAAFRMETDAIKAEQPLYNIRHGVGWIEPRARRSRAA